jgi:hypothetical protein
MSDEQNQELIAYHLYPGTEASLDPAPIARDWMDKAHLRHPYRCLPLVIANQHGWVLRSPAAFEAYWYGGADRTDVEIRYLDQPHNHIVSHFGSGVITFTVPFLFRTPPGMNLWVKGPSNWIKDGVQALEGVVETDWLASTFTMNWKITRICEWIRFEKGEPYCMIVPVPRGLIETLVPKRLPIGANPALQTQYQAWEASRRGFISDLQKFDPAAVQKGWQKDYFQGRTPDGKPFTGHQTHLNVKEFDEGDRGAPEG